MNITISLTADEDAILVVAPDVSGAEMDQSIMGSRWEVADGLAYAIVSGDDLWEAHDALERKGYTVAIDWT